MNMLDQHETYEPHRGSFFCPEAIETTGYERPAAPVAFPIMELADTVRLCEAITESADYLARPSLNKELFAAEEYSLEEMLANLKKEIKAADVITIDFPQSLASHTSAYDTLLSSYGREVSGGIRLGVKIPVESITAVHAQPCKASERLFLPRVSMCIKTGEEPQRLVIQEGEVAEIAGAPRWFDFPLQRAVFRVFEYVRSAR